MMHGHGAIWSTNRYTAPQLPSVKQRPILHVLRGRHSPDRRQRVMFQLQRFSTVAQARSNTKKGVNNSYHEQRARHVRAARDGSIVHYWASWRKWPSFKTVNNLKFLAYLFDGHQLDLQQLEQICPSIHAALEAQASTFTDDQVSRTLLYLSRLHIVPQESLWHDLMSRLGSQTVHDGQPGMLFMECPCPCVSRNDGIDHLRHSFHSRWHAAV